MKVLFRKENFLEIPTCVVRQFCSHEEVRVAN
jgi:hypothetical protein